jgi:hypothetical protein
MHNIHPNSILGKAMSDPELMRKFREWEKDFAIQQRELEYWGSGGCV